MSSVEIFERVRNWSRTLFTVRNASEIVVSTERKLKRLRIATPTSSFPLTERSGFTAKIKPILEEKIDLRSKGDKPERDLVLVEGHGDLHKIPTVLISRIDDEDLKSSGFNRKNRELTRLKRFLAMGRIIPG